MPRVARALALALLALGVVGALVGMVYLLVGRGDAPSEAAIRAMSPTRRGLQLVVHSRFGPLLVASCGGAALIGGFLWWFAWKGSRAAFLVTAVFAVGAIGCAWIGNRTVRRMEDPRALRQSRYVAASTRLAWGGTGYLGALAAASFAAFALSGRRGVSPAPSPASPSAGAT